MRTSSITRWSTLAAYLALVLSGCHTATTSSDITVLPYYQEASFTPQWYATPRAVPVDFHSIPDFALVDQRGEVVSERDVAGKVYIANFFFAACPGICPMTMANMARVQASFADEDEVLLISHSVTPERDSVAVLHAFAERMQALNDRWYLVTGEREQIYQLGKYSYFADEDLGASDMNLDDRQQAFLHTEGLFLIDQHRRIRGIYNGMNTIDVNRLIDDVRLLQQEGNEIALASL